MRHDNLIYVLLKKYPAAIHGQDFWVGHPINRGTGEQCGAPFIMDWRLEDTPMPTSEDIADLWQQYGEEALAHELSTNVRAQRDALLLELDSIVNNPLRFTSFEEIEQASLAEYRRALLDVPQQAGFPNAIDWPQKPASIARVGDP